MTDTASENMAWVNGRFVAAGEAAISPHDMGFQLGLGLFETIGAVADGLPFWDRHMARLAAAAVTMEIDWQPPQDLLAVAPELLRRNNHEGQVLRVTLTAGDAAAGDTGVPTWCLTTRARGEVKEPLRLHLSEYHRSDSDADPIAALKSTSYAFYYQARAQAWRQGADEALLLDREGRLQETATGNLILARGDRFLTPGRGNFLPGVARAVLLEELAADGHSVEKGDLTLDDLRQADAIYVTNAVHGPRLAHVAGVHEVEAVNDLRPLWDRALANA